MAVPMPASFRHDGITIAYERAGEGPPLVLVHGAAGDARLWRPQLDALADEFTVIAWDEPGAGRSSDLPAGFGLTDFADCLGGLVEATGVGPAHLCGLSWGGTVVLELYRRRPNLIRTLILADTYAGWKGSLPASEVDARIGAVREMLASEQDFDPVLPGLFAAEPGPEIAAMLAEVARDVRPESMAIALAAMAAADLREILPTIDAPTLLIWGEDDARSPMSVAREFSESIPRSNLRVIPGCGHVTNLERPEEFNQVVREFCRVH